MASADCRRAGRDAVGLTGASIVKYQTQLLIDGRWCESASGRTFETINPATERKLADVAEADAADVDRAARAARRAFEEGPWSRMSGRERGRLLFRLAD